MASLGNQHCANCIGTLSFPITTTVHYVRNAWNILLRQCMPGTIKFILMQMWRPVGFDLWWLCEVKSSMTEEPGPGLT